MKPVIVVDSHTAGEPTRVVIDGGPDLGFGSMTERLEVMRSTFDRYRSAIVNEPRGSDVMVGALLVAPVDPVCATGVIFFNNVGYLGMCGHGTMGVIATLAHLGRIGRGNHTLETPVGNVSATLHDDGSVSVTNVASYVKALNTSVTMPNGAIVRGDVAWGGNWFFLVAHDQHQQEIELSNLAALTAYAGEVRKAVNSQGFPEVDHVELFGQARAPEANSRNFVLCPGNAYDRSPCGTGTSAKLACLAARGELAADAPWVQESVIGSAFTARYLHADQDWAITPIITGRAFITGESRLRLDPADPYQWGIRG